MSITRDDLGLSCPNKGKFYVCDKAKIRFIGCCTVDPCADGSGNCPQDSLMPASFSSDHYDSISPQSCAVPSTSDRWFTCQSDQPPFLGCCSDNPCSNNGCPTGKLLAATLSDNNGNAQVFLNTGTPAPSSDSSGYSLSLGAILGIALGCAAVVAIALAILAYRCGWLAKRRKQGKESDGTTSQYGGPSTREFIHIAIHRISLHHTILTMQQHTLPTCHHSKMPVDQASPVPGSPTPDSRPTPLPITNSTTRTPRPRYRIRGMGITDMSRICPN